ncbi:hypothetical protein ACYSNR_01035 [Enterococcus sp. LJL128]
MKNRLLDIFHRAGITAKSFERGDWISAGWDRENQVDYIQIWFGNEDTPIVSYERNDGKWEFCDWANWGDQYVQAKLDHAIVKSLINHLKKTNIHKRAKAINVQLSLF